MRYASPKGEQVGRLHYDSEHIDGGWTSRVLPPLVFRDTIQNMAKQPMMYGQAPPMAGKRPMPRRMMADGDMGSPSDMDTPPPAAGDPDQDDDMDTPKIKPEAVNYHDDLHRCDGCQYYGGGNCEVLQMPVQAEGGCNAFDDGSGGGAQPDGGSSLPPGMNPEMMPGAGA